MKVYDTSNVRNIALVAHQSAGKTTLSEALLFNSGAIDRMGDIAQGTTTSDFDEEEQRRGLSLSTSIIPVEINGMKLNVLDTPGYSDFQGEVKNAVRVSDLVVVVVDAGTGVQVGTELYWDFADELDVPALVLLNKMNRDNARSADVLFDELDEIFHNRFVRIQLPIGLKGDFAGVVDLLSMKAYMGSDAKPIDIPEDMVDAAAEARLELMEAAAEADDSLLEKYFEEGELTDDEILRGVAAGLATGSFVPVAFSAADENIGVRALVDLLLKTAPMPTVRTYPTAGEDDPITMGDGKPVIYAFRTTADPYVGSLTYFRVITGTLSSDARLINYARGEEEERISAVYIMRGKEQISVDKVQAGDICAIAKLNVTVTGDTLSEKGHDVRIAPISFPQPIYAVAVSPATQADSAKMGPTLTRLCDEDLTLQWRQDPVTHESVLEGMGDVHIDVTMRRAQALGASLETAIPKVPYRETIANTGSARYRHKKQSGGAGQFGEVYLRVEPLERDSGFEFASEVFGGAISSSFIPSVEKGVKSAMEEGVIAGYPVVDIKAVVYDGKEHPVDSKDIAFQIAGREAFKLAVQDGKPILIEPVMRLRVTVPEQDMGTVIGDLSSRRGQVEGTDILSGKAIITALVPLAAVQRYSNDLRSFTQGRGVYTMELSHYDRVPSHVADEIAAEAKAVAEEV